MECPPGFSVRNLQPERAQARMIVGPSTEPPAILPVGVLDGQIIDAGNADSHQAFRIELPILVAVGTEELAAVVVPLIGEANGDTIVLERPNLLDKAVIEFLRPLACQERNNFSATGKEFGTVAPSAVFGVCQRHCDRIA